MPFFPVGPIICQSGKRKMESWAMNYFIYEVYKWRAVFLHPWQDLQGLLLDLHLLSVPSALSAPLKSRQICKCTFPFETFTHYFCYSSFKASIQKPSLCNLCAWKLAFLVFFICNIFFFRVYLFVLQNEDFIKKNREMVPETSIVVLIFSKGLRCLKLKSTEAGKMDHLQKILTEVWHLSSQLLVITPHLWSTLIVSTKLLCTFSFGSLSSLMFAWLHKRTVADLIACLF